MSTVIQAGNATNGGASISSDTSGSLTLVSGSSSQYTTTVPQVTGTMMVSGNMPAFSAYGSGFQTLTTSVATKIAFNTLDFDTNSNYSTSNYRFTPTVSGYYQVNASISSSSSASGYVGVNIYKNGSLYMYGNQIPNSLTGPTPTANGIVYCNGSTDYIEIYAIQNSGGNLTVGAGVSGLKFQAALVRAA